MSELLYHYKQVFDFIFDGEDYANVISNNNRHVLSPAVLKKTIADYKIIQVEVESSTSAIVSLKVMYQKRGFNKPDEKTRETTFLIKPNENASEIIWRLNKEMPEVFDNGINRQNILVNSSIGTGVQNIQLINKPSGFYAEKKQADQLSQERGKSTQPDADSNHVIKLIVLVLSFILLSLINIWLAIVVCALGVILYTFYSDTKKVHQKVRLQGGMQQKYSILVNGLLSEPNSRLLKLTNDTIVIQVNNKYAIVSFTIFQSFEKVVITWQQKSNLISDMTQKWEFADSINQLAIIEKIAADIKFRIDNEVDWSSVNEKIDKATLDALNNMEW